MWRRLRNIWKLSEFEPLGNKKLHVGDEVTKLFKPKLVQIIPRKKVDPIKELTGE